MYNKLRYFGRTYQIYLHEGDIDMTRSLLKGIWTKHKHSLSDDMRCFFVHITLSV